MKEIQGFKYKNNFQLPALDSELLILVQLV